MNLVKSSSQIILGVILGASFVAAVWLFLIFGIVYNLPNQQPIMLPIWYGSWGLTTLLLFLSSRYLRAKSFYLEKAFRIAGSIALVILLIYMTIGVLLAG